MRKLVAEADVLPMIASWLKELKAFEFLAAEDVDARGVDRRGAQVSRILCYKMVMGRGRSSWKSA
jgi:hypothetical protein